MKMVVHGWRWIAVMGSGQESGRTGKRAGQESGEGRHPGVRWQIERRTTHARTPRDVETGWDSILGRTWNSNHRADGETFFRRSAKRQHIVFELFSPPDRWGAVAMMERGGSGSPAGSPTEARVTSAGFVKRGGSRAGDSAWIASIPTKIAPILVKIAAIPVKTVAILVKIAAILVRIVAVSVEIVVVLVEIAAGLVDVGLAIVSVATIPAEAAASPTAEPGD